MENSSCFSQADGIKLAIETMLTTIFLDNHDIGGAGIP